MKIQKSEIELNQKQRRSFKTNMDSQYVLQFEKLQAILYYTLHFVVVYTVCIITASPILPLIRSTRH